MEGLNIDVKERLENPLDDVIEQDIVRQFGIVVSEDDFSPEGSIDYKEPSISNKNTNMEEVYGEISKIAEMIQSASEKRDKLKIKVKKNKS
jgi:antitoxin component YwqK of YwqJK toxin-antitoxin module